MRQDWAGAFPDWEGASQEVLGQARCQEEGRRGESLLDRLVEEELVWKEEEDKMKTFSNSISSSPNK